MRAKLSIVDDSGRTFEGEVTLHPPSGPRRRRASRAPASDRKGGSRNMKDLDFDLPTRAFVKKYVARMSGPARFTLLLAKLSKGEIGAGIGLGELTRAWNTMTQRMGRFNPAYSTRAHDNGWVSCPKRGFYALRSDWTETLRA